MKNLMRGMGSFRRALAAGIVGVSLVGLGLGLLEVVRAGQPAYVAGDAGSYRALFVDTNGAVVLPQNFWNANARKGLVSDLFQDGHSGPAVASTNGVAREVTVGGHLYLSDSDLFQTATIYLSPTEGNGDVIINQADHLVLGNGVQAVGDGAGLTNLVLGGVNGAVTNNGLVWLSTNATPVTALPNGSIATVTDGRFFVRSNGAWVLH